MRCTNMMRLFNIGLIGVGILILLVFAMALHHDRSEIADRDDMGNKRQLVPVLKESADKILVIKVHLINNGSEKRKEFEINGVGAAFLHDMLSAATNKRKSQKNRRGLATLNILYIDTPLVDYVEVSPDNIILVNGYMYDIDTDLVMNFLKKVN